MICVLVVLYHKNTSSILPRSRLRITLAVGVGAHAPPGNGGGSGRTGSLRVSAEMTSRQTTRWTSCNPQQRPGVGHPFMVHSHARRDETTTSFRFTVPDKDYTPSWIALVIWLFRLIKKFTTMCIKKKKTQDTLIFPQLDRAVHAWHTGMLFLQRKPKQKFDQGLVWNAYIIFGRIAHKFYVK